MMMMPAETTMACAPPEILTTPIRYSQLRYTNQPTSAPNVHMTTPEVASTVLRFCRFNPRSTLTGVMLPLNQSQNSSSAVRCMQPAQMKTIC